MKRTVQHNIEIDHNFDFKDSKMSIDIQNKKPRKIVESALFLTTTLLNKDLTFFYLISLFRQISAKKLQDSFSQIVLID